MDRSGAGSATVRARLPARTTTAMTARIYGVNVMAAWWIARIVTAKGIFKEEDMSKVLKIEWTGDDGVEYGFNYMFDDNSFTMRLPKSVIGQKIEPTRDMLIMSLALQMVSEVRNLTDSVVSETSQAYKDMMLRLCVQGGRCDLKI